MFWQDLFEFITENGHGATEKMVQNWQAKAVVGTLGAGIVSICDYISTPFLMFLALVMADLLTRLIAIGQQTLKNDGKQGNYFYGLWYANRKNTVQSKPMRTKGVNKIVQYMFVLATAFMIGEIMPAAFSDYSTFAFDWILFYLGVGEVKSIFENLQEAGMEEAAFFVRLFGSKKKEMEDRIIGK